MVVSGGRAVSVLGGAAIFVASLLIAPWANADTVELQTHLSKPTTAILVDKKTNTLSVTEYQDGEYHVVKTFHATLGKVQGDKQDEADLKTPEGIYTFNERKTPPSLPRKFGDMAFALNYPNTYDELAGHTGNGIMLHATDTPDRLKQDYDSEGCVVVNNEEIHEIQPYIRLGLTPILIFQDLTDDYKHPGQDSRLKAFFESWIHDWESKDIEGYISHYHSDFSGKPKNKRMNRDEWKDYKESLNKMYATIEVRPEDVMFYRHPKYSMITFTQNYRSKMKDRNGNPAGWGHRSRGTKILYVAEEAGQPKIIAETYTELMW